MEFAGLRVVDGEVVEEFSRLANPGGPLSLAITKLTGIRDDDLRRERRSHVVLSDFLRFLDDDVVVAHNAGFERRFLAAKSDGYFQNTMLDTLELARILYPTFSHHDLDTLIAELGLEVGERHRALDDARVLVALWGRLLARLEALPFEVVAALSAVATRVRWPGRRVFLEAEAKRLTGAFDTGVPDYGKVLASHGKLLDQARQARRQKEDRERPPPQRIDAGELTATFGEGGLFDQRIPGYEVRPQQIRMVELVAEAFNEGQHLLVEAGTGVGKSMAYLLPAIRWAQTNGDKIVVSTNTKNLQEQLFFKDLPLIAQTCDLDVKTALIKGRANYLCVRKLLYLLEESERELSEEEHVAFLPLLVWAAETETGDIAECTGFLAFRERDLWARLCASSEECPGPHCRQRTRCFLNRARALSLTSDVVVANHAVVFSEIDLESVVLPDYAHLVFDEAHNLEDVATNYLGCEADHWMVRRVVQRLLRRDRGRRERGLLPSIRYRLKKGRETELTESEKHLDQMIVDTYPHVDAVEERLRTFLQAVGEVFVASGGRRDAVRYDAEHRDPQLWAMVDSEKRHLISVLGKLRVELGRIAERLEAPEERPFPYRTESLYDLRGVQEQIETLGLELEFLVAGADSEYVYWVERYGRRRTRYRLAAAPVRVGPRLKDMLYEDKDTIVFTSATLSAAGRFDFLKDRTGLDLLDEGRLVEEDVGSPFDYDRQMLICVPTFMREPDRDGGDFTAQVARVLIDIFRASAGRGMALFTAYSMLNQVYPELKAALEAEQMLVLGQGIDGERRAITRMFRRETSSVLLGTESFREGVDVPGESLSCLVLVK
ncbi:MAG: exonuclease domain-containing protein, partial [Planctomycetota bacterium]